MNKLDFKVYVVIFLAVIIFGIYVILYELDIIKTMIMAYDPSLPCIKEY